MFWFGSVWSEAEAHGFRVWVLGSRFTVWVFILGSGKRFKAQLRQRNEGRGTGWGQVQGMTSMDRLRAGWLTEGYHESRRCSRDTYLESYTTKYTSIRRLGGGRGAGRFGDRLKA